MTSGKRKGIKRDRTPLELGVLAASLLGIVSIVGGLLWYGITSDGGQAELLIVLEFVEEGSGGKVYDLMVTNGGGTTAEEVIVEVSLGETTREVQFKAVPKGDSETATVVLPAMDEEPRAELVGYKEP